MVWSSESDEESGAAFWDIERALSLSSSKGGGRGMAAIVYESSTETFGGDKRMEG